MSYFFLGYLHTALSQKTGAILNYCKFLYTDLADVSIQNNLPAKLLGLQVVQVKCDTSAEALHMQV